MSVILDIATVATPIVAGAGLVFTGQQLKGARGVARSQFLLELDRRFHEFDDIQLHIEHPEWEPQDGTDEAFRLARYMALFERISHLVDSSILDLATVDKLYGWRLEWMLQNVTVRKRLLSHPMSWQDLNRLWLKLDELRMHAERETVCPGQYSPSL